MTLHSGSRFKIGSKLKDQKISDFITFGWAMKLWIQSSCCKILKGKISCIRREAVVAHKLVRHMRTINLRNIFLPLKSSDVFD